MAHRIKVEPIPHKNADGKFSKSKKDYQIIDKTRRGRVVVGVAGAKSDIQPMIDKYRAQVVAEHLAKHPNDKAFMEKHKIGEE